MDLATSCHQKENSRGRGWWKEGCFYCSMVQENGGCPVSRLIRLISSVKHRQNPAIPSKTKTKGSAQNSCSVLNYYPLEPKVANWWSQNLSLFPAVQLQAAIGHVASSSKVPRSLVVQPAKALVHTPLGWQERDFLMEAMGSVTAVMWSMERTVQYTLQVQVLSSSCEQDTVFFVSWDLY